MTAHYTLLTLTALALIGGPALAQPIQTGDERPRQAAVSYADLNLNTAQGQAKLKARIQHAAETVCGPEPDSRDVKAQMAFRGCLKLTSDTAIAAIPSASQLAGSSKPAG